MISLGVVVLAGVPAFLYMVAVFYSTRSRLAQINARRAAARLELYRFGVNP